MIDGLISFFAGAWKLAGRALKAAGNWLRQPHDWWRIGCLAGATVCAYLAIQLRGTEVRADAAEAQVVTVTEQAKIDVKAEKDKGEQAVKAERQVCATQRAEANAIANKRIAELEAANRAWERRLSTKVAEIAAQHSKEIEDAERTGDAVAAGVRDGSVRLRDEWAGQGTGGGSRGSVPGAAAAAAGADEAAELRAKGAGDLVQLLDSADADIRACQAVILLDREAQPAKVEAKP